MRTLIEYGLANAAAATALAVVALLVGLVVRRPAVRNALWVLVLVRLLLPPVWTIPLPVPDLRPETSDDVGSSIVADASPPTSEPLIREWVLLDDPSPDQMSGEQLADADVVADPQPALAPSPAVTPAAAGMKDSVDPFVVLGV